MTCRLEAPRLCSGYGDRGKLIWVTRHVGCQEGRVERRGVNLRIKNRKLQRWVSAQKAEDQAATLDTFYCMGLPKVKSSKS